VREDEHPELPLGYRRAVLGIDALDDDVILDDVDPRLRLAL
jgi:hypothetical protein